MIPGAARAVQKALLQRQKSLPQLVLSSPGAKQGSFKSKSYSQPDIGFEDKQVTQ